MSLRASYACSPGNVSSVVFSSNTITRFVIIDGNTKSLIFQNNSFVENIFGPAIEFDISGSSGQVAIQRNRFLHNVIPKIVTLPLQARVMNLIKVKDSLKW